MIIKQSNEKIGIDMVGVLPDQFVSQKTKEKETFIKSTMDFFSNVASHQYKNNQETFAHNYNLVKGILRPEDFFLKKEDGGETKSFVEALLESAELPEHVKHYSIFNPPLYTLLGELTKRPDFTRVKAFDDDSKQEELSFKTDMV